MTPQPRPIQILLVEDSPTDILMAQEALAEACAINHVQVAENGDDAVRFLRRQPPFVSAPRPDLVLLDLNLPRKTGLEVLAEIKSDEDLKRIPVVVMTTSRAESDVRQAYAAHANCYIAKPSDFGHFAQVLKSVEEFWLCLVTLPGQPS